MRKFILVILIVLLSVFNCFAFGKSEKITNTNSNTISLENEVSALVENYRQTASDLADNIWGFAELAGHEQKSVQQYIDVLSKQGIEVQTNVGGISTAFSASYGSGFPVIALLAEYDSVSGVSQKAGAFEKEALSGSENGHACGHNLLGAGCLQAFLALRDYIKQTGVSGTVILFGCPAEESGGGKTFMTRAGVFDKVDIALSWHPGDWTGIIPTDLQADVWMRYTFEGKASHAASAPEMGRSALDSVELMNVGANYLREHVSSDVCFHYAVIDTGGVSPNVVQNHACVEYLIRAANVKTANEIRERIDNIAKGAAMMSSTKVNIEFVTGCSQYEGNICVGNQVYSAMQKLGDPKFSDEEKKFAADISKTFVVQGVTNAVRPFMNNLIAVNPEKKYLLTASLNDAVLIYTPLKGVSAGTSDVGDVSQKCPTIMFMVTCWAQGTAGHSWQAVSQGKSSLAHTGMTYAAKAMALTAINYMKDTKLVDDAWTEFNNTHSESYICPIPKEIQFEPNSK